PPAERSEWWTSWRSHQSLLAGVLALALALIIAVPWHVFMAEVHGAEFLKALFNPFDLLNSDPPGLQARLISLAPATLPLGLFAVARTIRLALTDESDDREIVGAVFWVVWLATAALAPAFWPSGSRTTLNLFLLVPLNLLTARAIVELANRRVPVRRLTWLAP